MAARQPQMTKQSRSSNSLVVPQAMAALDQMKYEVAQELGIQIPADGYMGYMTTREAGLIGGNITRRLIQMAEMQISGSSQFR
ncbi:alpha/beta-type small acid-soluble spore protein [Paenibacillus koleovorans]|uniref:alpha/beta-type small acid-soluble spore protein n=1 Tax=Paenibacillus koleovorans TaxID=121608 RepID=UPI0024823A91|nr:alpha/beta-type small acid-soluble spore protein [Paenibacillus koleovorans]